MPDAGSPPKRKAGRPKGSKSPRSIEKLEMLRQFRERIATEFGPLMDAQIQAALGVSHMMAKDRTGKWMQVTDPKAMARCLNSGEAFYRIHAQNPDVRALKDIFDRLMGSPAQTVEMSGPEGGPLEVRWQS
jgi:hypothetical protein